MRLINSICFLLSFSAVECSLESAQVEENITKKNMCPKLQKDKKVSRDSCGCSIKQITETSLTDSVGTIVQSTPLSTSCYDQCMEQLGTVSRNFDFEPTQPPTTMGMPDWGDNWSGIVTTEIVGTDAPITQPNNGGGSSNEGQCPGSFISKTIFEKIYRGAT